MPRNRRDTNASPLHACYDSVETLEDYLGVNATAPRTMGEGRDRTRYESFLGTTYVCNVKYCGNRPAARAPLPIMSMRDVVRHAQALIIKREKTEKNNILTVGCAMNKAKKVHSSSMVTAFHSEEWSTLLSSMGAEKLLDALTNTSIFMTLPNHCLLQLTGKPIPRPSPPARDKTHKFTSKKRLADKLDTEPPAKRPKLATLNRTGSGNQQQVQSVSKSPNEIIFARQRLFYGRPTSLPGNTNLTLCGLYPRHILNQLMPAYPPGSDLKHNENELEEMTEQAREKAQQEKARCLSKYVFPRQYGLRSAFAFEVEGWGGVLLPNFEDRSDEIQRMPKPVKTPKRVKPALVLLERLIWRHGKCKYALLRDATCPTKRKPDHSRDNDAVLELFASSISQIKSQVSLNLDSEGVFSAGPEPSPNNKPRILEYACSHTEVFRYVRAVIKAVIPNEFWGGEQNFKLVCDFVKEFVSARRFESISLHNALQGFSTTGCEWLAPGKGKEQTRVAASDMHKRRELLEDFMYWFFDSFVMHVLKTTFYITESAPLRNRVLYFLHDDWRWLCAPLIQRLTSETFHKLTTEEARDIVRKRSLGISFVRLLPKESGVRPIVNLRRKKGKNDFSINQVLRAAFEILTLERKNHPELLGTSILGRNDTYTKLKSFKKTMLNLHNQELPKLYFVKVDVQACFDNIDQTKLLEILQQVVRHSHYNIEKYLRVAQPAGHNISHKWLRRAFVDEEPRDFLEYAKELSESLRGAVFANLGVIPYQERRSSILTLLSEHINNNIVKIGTDYYRQTIGIPQGSILSSILCAFFYGDMEKDFAEYTEDPQSLLMRLVDDYLFVTSDLNKACRFLDMMTEGHPEYGCFISKDKTMMNFDYKEHVSNRVENRIPWCGLVIDTENLSVYGDYARYNVPSSHMRDTLTVVKDRVPGATFQNKMLLLSKAKNHPIFSDEGLNSKDAVYQNVYQNFKLCAMKLHAYVREWRQAFISGERGTRMIHRTVKQMIAYSFASLRAMGRSRCAQDNGYVFGLNMAAVYFLGWKAFFTALDGKAPIYKPMLARIEKDMKRPQNLRLNKRFGQVIKSGEKEMEGLRF